MWIDQALMGDRVELQLKGTYFKHEYGETVPSTTGTPGVELRLGNAAPVYLDYEQCSLIAKTIGRLYGSSSEVALTVFEGKM